MKLTELTTKIRQTFETMTRRQILLLAGIAGFIIAAFVTLILFAVLKQTNSYTNTPESGISNVALKIGNSPNIAPCSILPVATLDKLSKGLLTPSGTYAYEVYYDKNLPSERNDLVASPAESRCSYKTVESNTDKSVAIDVAYATEPDKYPELLAAIRPDKASISTDIEAIEKILGAQNTGAAKSFVSRLNADREKISSYASENSPVPVGAVIPYLLTTQGDSSASSPDQELGFIVFTKYALVKMQMTATDKAIAFNSLTPAQLTSRLELAQKITDEILLRTSDNTLTDKTTGGNLGSVATPWNQEILDPCHILTDSFFVATAGVSPNDKIIRTTFPYKRDYTNQLEKNIGLASNDCTKSYRESYFSDEYIRTDAESQLGNGGSATVTLTVAYAKDESQAKTYVTVTSNDGALIPSVADEARRIDAQGITFRKGAYAFQLDVSVRGNNGVQPLTDEKARELIQNTISNM